MTAADVPRREGARWARVAAQAGIAGVVGWFAVAQLAQHWAQLRLQAATLQPRWGGVVGSAAVVLVTYALLIHSWRVLVAGWGGHLGFVAAARIWAVSNLGRYVPGKLWSISAMGVLAQRAGVSPVAATGSALVGTVVNIAAAAAVVAVAGAPTIRAIYPDLAAAGVWLAAAAGVGLIAAPLLVPSLARLAARLARRPEPVHELRPGTLAVVVGANVVSWLGYGLAFRWLAASILPNSGGGTLSYVAVFAGSYLAGYLVLVVPGGIGVHELVLVAALTRLNLTDAPGAALLAVASRLWLTVLELAPGLLFLAHGSARALSRSPSDVNA